jgi:lipoprotein-anchoring transpeptidase ErfK/SrfK
MNRLLMAVASVATLAALTGCGGGDTAVAPGSAPSTSARTVAASTPASSRVPAGTVANVIDPAGVVQVRTEPAPTGKLRATLKGRTVYKTALTLPVLDRVSAWLYVTLPTRPNGATGWVQAGLFRLAATHDSIKVDLSDRKITMSVGGRTTTSSVGVGSAKYPTPVAEGSVTDNLDLSKNPEGAYGVIALGLSIHSTALTEFGGGDGQVGIHGTSDQASIGKNVTHGCIRVPRDVEKVLARVPVGTPVTITP